MKKKALALILAAAITVTPVWGAEFSDSGIETEEVMHGAAEAEETTPVEEASPESEKETPEKPGVDFPEASEVPEEFGTEEEMEAAIVFEEDEVVFAEEGQRDSTDEETLNPETLPVLLEKHEGEAVTSVAVKDGWACAKLVPERDGEYVLEAKEGTADCAVILYDEEFQEEEAIDGAYYLSSGLVYYVKVQTGKAQGTVSFSLTYTSLVELSSCWLKKPASDMAYTGEALTPDLSIWDGYRKLEQGVDYKLTYSNNTGFGTAKVVAEGMGIYRGTVEAAFKILPGAPVLQSVTPKSYNSIRIVWDAVPGATGYVLYYKTDTSNWKVLVRDYKWTSYTHCSNAKNPLKTGTKYTYTVRAVGGSCYGKYDTAGKSATASLDVVELGDVCHVAYNKLKVTWKPVAGANGYRVYLKSGAGWTYLGSTSSTSYLHTGSAKAPVHAGVDNTYTVRAYRMEENKRITGPYSTVGTQGRSHTDAPKLVKAAASDYNKITITWTKVPEATKYMIYRKNASGRWERMAAVSGDHSSYTHVSSESWPVVLGQTYTYTVRSYTSLGNTYGGFDAKGIQVKADLKAVVWKDITKKENGLLLQWEKDPMASSYVVYRMENGRWKRKAVTSSLSYLDTNVEKNVTYQYCIRSSQKVNGRNYYGPLSIKEGMWKDLSPAQLAARAKLDEIGWTLNDAFQWSAYIPYVRPATEAPDASCETEWYAKYAFDHGVGHCYVKAAAFCYMARELGYEARLVKGYVPTASGSLSEHGWTEVKFGDTWYVFDLSFHQSVGNGWMITYGQKGTWKYTNYHIAK